MATSKLSIKYQIVVPRAVRQQLKLRAGMRVYITPLNDRRALLTAMDDDPVRSLEGLGQDIWKKLGGTHRYMRKERSTWKRK